MTHYEQMDNLGAGVSLKYFLTTPTDFDPGRESLPMIVFLHGWGERGNTLEVLQKHGIPKYFGKDQDFRGHRVITLSPQCDGNLVWDNIVLETMELIRRIAKQVNADPDRISITGLSMGGYGTWNMLCCFPDFFSYAAPICGGGLPWRIKIVADRLPPIWAFHGDADPTVPLVCSTLMVDAARACGVKAELSIFHGVTHNSWARAYETTDIIERMIRSTRAPRTCQEN